MAGKRGKAIPKGAKCQVPGCDRPVRAKGRCKSCYDKHRFGCLPRIYLPSEPLKAFDGFDAHERVRQLVYRKRLTLKAADTAAVALGLHPFYIWGFDFYEMAEEVA